MRRPLDVLIFALMSMLFATACAAAEPPGSIVRDCHDCPEMVVVPPGRFVMGARADEHARFGVAAEYAATELPAHDVRFTRPFAIGRTPVTRDEWARYVATTTDLPTGCNVHDGNAGNWGVDARRSWRDPGFAQGDREPVVCVNLPDAKGYAAWLSARTGRTYRLPTEAEWEYAARGGTTSVNYWGDTHDDACRHTNVADLTRIKDLPNRTALLNLVLPCEDGYVYTSPVDAFPPNPFGLYGMSGNVNQMVEDCFHANFEGAPVDGSLWSGGDCRYHMDRGASWVNSPRFVRVAMRHKDLVDARISVLGFRLVREMTP